MRSGRLHIALIAALAIYPTLLFGTGTSAAAQEMLLHSFRPYGSPPCCFHARTADGFDPFYSNLTIDTAGNLYGTTTAGGIFGYGTVFKLTHTASGWTEAVIYAFGHNLADGGVPEGGLTLDAAGNLYGTTHGGGANNSGVVFELVNNGDGTWAEKVLYSFNNTDGYGPWAAPIFDAAGNLYGTTESGGAYNYGTAYELTPTGGGNWSEQVLHSFGNGTDGATPFAGLVMDAAGNLYGTTWLGGANLCDGAGCGTVFKLSPTGGGNWSEQVIHNFINNGVDGNQPWAGSLIFDSSGNLYGTTTLGGTYLCEGGSVGCGTVYEMTPTAGGNWTEQVIYSFNGGGPGGEDPTSAVLFDAAGNLYGTTYFGGLLEGGTAFKLTLRDGRWTEQVLHPFGASGDGVTPASGLIFDRAGNLYGTTMEGGLYDGGTAYEITP